MKDSKFNSQYNLIKEIGSGGFGTVHEAILHGHGRVAIKKLTAGIEENTKRFKREVAIQSKLNHRNIISVLECDLEADTPWFAMPLASTNLNEQMHYFPYDFDSLNHVFRQILEGISYAHAIKVVHRDLKPENILIFPGNNVRISDFGLGKELDRKTLRTTVTRSGEGFGSVIYAAPEQWKDFKNADQRSDIFALGKILYEMVTGEEPFPELHLNKVESRYRYIISKCTDSDPSKRYQSVWELINHFDLVTKNEKEFETQLEASKQFELILNENPSIESILQLHQLFIEHEDNENHYHSFFPKVREQFLDLYLEHNYKGFVDQLKIYDSYVDGSLWFEYCDVVAQFYSEIYRKTEDINIQRLILNRLLQLGVSHNRYFVQNTFCDIISKIEDVSTALVAVEVIQANPDEIYALEENLLNRNMLLIIKNKIKDVVDSANKDRGEK